MYTKQALIAVKKLIHIGCGDIYVS